jgi:putative transcriptional regulator
MTTAQNLYHYTESGLDDVYLVNGFEYLESGGRRQVMIKDIEGLHKAIGRYLVFYKRSLTGREFRFLRHEMGMSQKTLATFLNVTEQTINRWETGKSEIPGAALSLARLLYEEHIDEKSEIRVMLKRIADLEDGKEQPAFQATDLGWRQAA